MEKLNVTVGFVFTQVMFCDGQGKLQFHRVMTDVDKPWESVKELLGLVKNALSMDKPKIVNSLMGAIHIQLEYKKVNFYSLLITLREELAAAFKHCQVLIENLQDDVEPTQDEPVEELVTLDSDPVVFEEDGQVLSIRNGQAEPFFNYCTMVKMEDEDAYRKEDVLHFGMINQEGVISTLCSYQRGSPTIIC